MSIEIKDIRKLEEKERIEAIYQALVSISDALTFIPDGKLPIGTILPFARTKEMRLPDGFEICDGKKQTKNLFSDFTAGLVYIQRVR